MTVAPILAVDTLVHEAATRAFGDLAQRWFAHDLGREGVLAAVEQLGFTDALPSPDGRDAWPTAAAIIRAQARAAAPIDMAWLLATGDRAGSIAQPAGAYACAASADAPGSPALLAALSLGRCLQIDAAMEAALELSLQYVQDRKQFGQALAKFQAIQHSLALAAEEVAACSVISDLALACAAHERILGARMSALLDTAAVVVGRGVDVVYDVCHQVHGAIGFTQEYALHRHSLDVLRWRDHLQLLRGGELRCAERLGDAALEAGSVWRAVTAVMKLGGSHD
jgi:acyl-CoA dehydrogenase